VVLGNTTTLVVGRNLMLLVMTMVGIEDVGKLADLVLDMDSLDMGITELGMLELLLDFFYFFAEFVVEGVEDFLEAAFGAPRTGGRRISHV
jgi:hypothetical protein